MPCLLLGLDLVLLLLVLHLVVVRGLVVLLQNLPHLVVVIGHLKTLCYRWFGGGKKSKGTLKFRYH